MGIFILSSSIIFIYSLFWIFLSSDRRDRISKIGIDRTNRRESKKLSVEASDTSEDKNKVEPDNTESTLDEIPEPFVIDEIPWISSLEYAKYDFLEYSVRELSYPEEETRYYAVVTMTGGPFNKNKVNAIIHFNGTDKSNIYGYGLIPPEFLKTSSLIGLRERHIWSFDEVKRRLNTYIKDKLNGNENNPTENWKTYYPSYAYYFKTIEEATFALCAFKQMVDEKLRKRSLSVHNISENIINVKFEE